MVYYSCYASPSGRISPCFFGTSAGALEPLALACAPQVDPGEDHGELRRLEFDAVAFGGAGHREGSALESLVPDDQPVTIKEEDLDPIPPSVEEEEDKAGRAVRLPARYWVQRYHEEGFAGL